MHNLVFSLAAVLLAQGWAYPFNTSSMDSCSVPVAQRIDCGDIHTTPESCVAKGCCWEVESDPTRPNCYNKGGGPGPTSGPAPGGKKVYVHMMPWFETKASSGTGKWGIHWTMANKNPDNIVGGKRDIASRYHPLIDAYASGDSKVIDWQLGLMKLSGIAGVLIDWPGTSGKMDYAGNMRNAEAIIARTAAHGLEFGIVYEDHNLDLAQIADKIGQGKADMTYVRDHYFSQSNHIKVNGKPLLLDFGPQTLVDGQWGQIFTPFQTKPEFIILWNQPKGTAGASQGEFAWPAADWLSGLNSWYGRATGFKIGCAYPGFDAFYKEGGWGDIPWKIPPSVSNFQQSLDLALAHTDIVQVATWNDYGEGTIIEPTLEFGYGYLTTLQRKMGVSYTEADLKKVTDNYHKRVLHANNATMLSLLEQEHFELVNKYN